MANCVIAYDPCFSCAEKKCEICELDMHRKGVFRQSEDGTDTNVGCKFEWISVDERLPEETCECLAVSKFGTISLVNYSNRYKAFNATDDYDDGDRWKFSDVTHWMPLPEAPKMKGGAE